MTLLEKAIHTNRWHGRIYYRERSSLTGFTLIEILLSITILSIVIAGIFAVLKVADVSWHSDTGLLDLQQQARQVMDGMVRELRQSGRTLYNIAVDGDGRGVTFSTPDIANIRYYLDTNSSRVIRQQPSGTGETKVLSNNITNLSLCWWDDVDCCDAVVEDCSNLEVLQIQLSATKTVDQRQLLFPLTGEPLTEKVRLRNE